MDSQVVREILEKFEDGLLTESEAQQLEQWIEEGHVDLEDLKDLNNLSEQVGRYVQTEPPKGVDNKFWAWMSVIDSTADREGKLQWLEGFLSRSLSMRFVLSSVLIFAMGVLAGIFLNVSQKPGELIALQNEVSNMRQLMMITLLEKESPSDRLRAVQIVEELTDVNDQVVQSLITTLQSDPNTNVRLAALAALYPYTRRPNVREGLIHSIQYQDSPLVLISLADLMVSMNEKKSAEEFQKQLQKDLPEEVRSKLASSIEKLI